MVNGHNGLIGQLAQNLAEVAAKPGQDPAQTHPLLMVEKVVQVTHWKIRTAEQIPAQVNSTPNI